MMARRSLWLACTIAAAVGLAAAPAAARKPKPKPAKPDAPAAKKPAGPIDVTVVQIAGNHAFLRPGSTSGVFRGARVTLNHKDYVVAQSTDSFAVIDLEDDSVHEDDKGRAALVDEEVEKPVDLPKPQRLSTWQGFWTEPAAPADAQTPRFIPIGDMETNRRYDVRLSAAAGGLIPLGQRGIAESYAELDARVHAEPFQAPIAIDADAALQDWFAANLDQRAGGSSRPLLYVRELLASYRTGNFFGGIGRMRYAASTLGTLDGLRASVGVGGGFTVGAFGGLLPNPLSSAPSLDAQRFGVEATYKQPRSELRPEASLVVHGSTFQGALDERRLSGTVSLYPGTSRMGGHFEVSSFPSNNPWQAGVVELTAAGIDTSVRAGIFSLGGRFNLRQPERSLWLANYLPLSWFCRTRPASAVAGAPEVCDGSVSTRAFGEVDAGLDVGNFSLFLGGTTTSDLTQTDGYARSVGGFATARVARIARVLRIDVSGNYSQGTYLNMLGGTVGPGVTILGDAVDLSAYYRNTTLQYRVDSSTLMDHGVGGTVLLFPSSVVAFALQGEGLTGDDARALMVFGTVTWRPRL